MVFPTLSVRDLEVSLDFYTRQLGVALDFSLLGADGTTAFARVSLGRARLGLTRVRNTNFDSSAVGFMVYLPDETDLERYYEEVQARGTTIVEPLQIRYWGDRNFVVLDPDGYALAMSKLESSLSVEDLAVGTRADASLAYSISHVCGSPTATDMARSCRFAHANMGSTHARSCRAHARKVIQRVETDSVYRVNRTTFSCARVGEELGKRCNSPVSDAVREGDF